MATSSLDTLSLVLGLGVAMCSVTLADARTVTGAEKRFSGWLDRTGSSAYNTIRITPKTAGVPIKERKRRTRLPRMDS